MQASDQVVRSLLPAHFLVLIHKLRAAYSEIYKIPKQSIEKIIFRILFTRFRYFIYCRGIV